jgi:transketolase
MKKTSNVAELQAIAKQIRREIVEMITHAKSGHPGGSLSAVEILVTLFFDVMQHNPQNPKWPDRDRFILSKGHAAPVLYSVMAECGYTPKDQLNTLRKLGSIRAIRMCASSRRWKPPPVRWAKGSQSGSAWR